jgi:hypothetical protein
MNVKIENNSQQRISLRISEAVLWLCYLWLVHMLYVTCTNLHSVTCITRGFNVLLITNGPLSACCLIGKFLLCQLVTDAARLGDTSSSCCGDRPHDNMVDILRRIAAHPSVGAIVANNTREIRGNRNTQVHLLA